MKSYLINLDRSPDRLQFFAQQANSLGIEFERISAVDGRKMTAAELAEVVSPVFEFQPLNAGEIGVFMSHREAWKRLVSSGAPQAAVFEDDVLLVNSVRQILSAIDTQYIEFDIIKLETTLRPVVCAKSEMRLQSGNVLQRLLTWHGGAAGYVISARCALTLLNLSDRLADPVDQVMFNPMSSICSQLRILQLNPAGCVQKDILSELDSAAFGTTIDRNVTRGRLFRHGLFVDVRRMLKKQFERQRRKWLAMKKENCQVTIPFEKTEQLRRVA